MAGPNDRAPEQQQGPDSLRTREADPVGTDLRQRMERLPPSHPSSPYNDDGSRKPPVPDPFEHDYPIPGDPDYVAADDGPDQDLPSGDREAIRDLDSREQHERRLSQITDQLTKRCREAEGRDADGNYGEQGLTPAMRRIESQLDHGRLAPDTEKFALKSTDRLREKFAKLTQRYPGENPEKLVNEIHDGIRYTFLLDTEDYVAGAWEATDKLQRQGFELMGRTVRWSDAEYKGVNTRWRDPESGLLFEVQLHTPESWDAKQQTHEAYEKINDVGTPVKEVERLRRYQREVSAHVPLPANWQSIPDYRKENK